MICLLQNCWDFVDVGNGSCSETHVTGDGHATEEVNIKVEEAIDIKDEMPEDTSFPSIENEREVRLLGYV
jgi:hypothetical protein